jgi:hypothetical protein
MKVNIQELKQLCELILTHLEQQGYSEIEREQDAYWTVISREDLYANDGHPKLGGGSLSDDLESLEKILDGTNPPTTIDFHGLGNILIAIGDQIDRSMRGTWCSFKRPFVQVERGMQRMVSTRLNQNRLRTNPHLPRDSKLLIPV